MKSNKSKLFVSHGRITHPLSECSSCPSCVEDIKTFTFIVKNKGGTISTNYEEEITKKQEQELRVILYNYVKENCK